MTEAPPLVGHGPAAHEASAWLDDWITIWHSELAAAITDREAQETLLRLLDLWAASARQAAAAVEPLTRPPAPPRPAAAAAAPDGRPDGRDAVIAGLLARVAELERRLDGLSRG